MPVRRRPSRVHVGDGGAHAEPNAAADARAADTEPDTPAVRRKQR